MKERIFSLLILSSLFIAPAQAQATVYNLSWYGHAEAQGKRSSMEDAHFFRARNYLLFGLFDGHGGKGVADYAARHMPNIFKEIISKDKTLTVTDTLKKAFLKVNEFTLDSSLDAYSQGCTALCAHIEKGIVTIANAGDSRAVISCAGKAKALSKDHKPNDPIERKRIEQLGGHVIHYGCYRLQGILAISRALGDKQLEPYITAQPEITHRLLQKTDEFLILACDGVWDVLNNQQAVDIVRMALRESNNDPRQAAQTLTDQALLHGSTDNVSALVVLLNNLPAQYK